MRALAEKLIHFWYTPGDERSYALVRIGYGIAALVTWASLFPDRHQYFSSVGMKVSMPTAHFLPAWYGRVFELFDAPEATTAIFLFGGCSLICLIFGIFSRLAVFGSYLWVCAYSFAISPAYSAQDDIFCAFGFLLLISPLGRVWSVDRLLFGGRSASSSVPSYGLKLMRLQLIVIYLTTVSLKLQDPHWRDGTVVPYFYLSLYSRISTPLIAHYASFLTFITYSALVIEGVIPFLLAIRRTRILGLILGVSFHLLIGVTSVLTELSLAMIICYFAFVEPATWSPLSARRRSVQ